MIASYPEFKRLPWICRTHGSSENVIAASGTSLFYYIQDSWQMFAMVGVVMYSMLDMITYLLMLILMSDIQRPSANIIRSLRMFFVNYIELHWILLFCIVATNMGIKEKCFRYGRDAYKEVCRYNDISVNADSLCVNAP